MLSDVLPALRCPAHPAEAEQPLFADGATLRCGSGHAFDVARQGYVNLASRDPGTGDTAAMVRARDAWLDRGHFAPLSERLAALVAEWSPALMSDVGAGTGHYLAKALDAAESAVGLAVDLSRHAARCAARKHQRIGAVVADAWGPLPVRTHGVDLLLNVFAPRNGQEFARVLRPGGLLVVAAPAAHHLAELSETVGLLSVDQDKRSRLSRSLEPHFSPASGPLADSVRLEFELRLSRQEAAEAVAMGPSAWHLSPDSVQSALARRPEPIVTTAAIDVSCWTPREP